MRRLPVPLIYLLILSGTMQFGSMFALGGHLEDRFSLSKLEIGAFFAATGFAQIAAAVPVGMLADRHGARRFTLVGGFLLGLGGLGIGLASGFWMLVAFRAVFGIGFVTSLTAGPKWLADSVAPARRGTAVAAMMPIAALGGVIGAPTAGALADAFGVRVPLVLLGAISLAAAAALAAAPHGGRSRTVAQPFLEVMRTIGRQRLAVGAVLLMGTAAMCESVTSVLGPLRLNDNGLSAGLIGLVIAGGALLFVPVASFVAHRATRLARLPTAAVALLALTVVLVPLAASTSTGPVVVGLILRTGVLGMLYSLAMPLGAFGAERAGLGGGAVYGLLQMAAGLANATGPLLATGVAEATSERVVYLGAMALCLVMAAWMASAAAAARRVANRYVELEGPPPTAS